jgi:nicotinamidase-related amidase
VTLGSGPAVGTSQLAHQAGIDRVVQAGGKPVSWIQVACELQRDWNRAATAQGFAEIVLRSVGH